MKCAHCGKTTTFGHNRSFSLRATNRKFQANLQRVSLLENGRMVKKANLQRVSLLENGRMVKKVLCTKCIRTAAKSN